MNDDPPAIKILRLRAELLELGSAIRQLQRSGLDSASAQLLITRRRAGRADQRYRTEARARRRSDTSGEQEMNNAWAGR